MLTLGWPQGIFSDPEEVHRWRGAGYPAGGPLETVKPATGNPPILRQAGTLILVAGLVGETGFDRLPPQLLPLRVAFSVPGRHGNLQSDEKLDKIAGWETNRHSITTC